MLHSFRGSPHTWEASVGNGMYFGGLLVSVLPSRYNEEGGKSRLGRLGPALIIESARTASESEVAHLAAWPRRGPGSSPWRNLWRWWPHTSLGDTGPWEQRPPACTGRGTKYRGKYRPQSDGDTLILWIQYTVTEYSKDTLKHKYSDTLK